MRRHATLLAGAVAGTVMVAALVATSLLFANSDGTESVARDASIQLRAEQTLSAATVARSLLGEAVVLATARLGGGGDEEALEAMVDQAEATLTETGRRADVLLAEMGGRNSEVEGSVAAFVTAARDLADALVRERAVGTIEAHFGSVTGTFDQLTAVLVAERDRREHEAHGGENRPLGLRHDEQAGDDDRGDEEGGHQQPRPQIPRDQRRKLIAIVRDVVHAEHVEPEVGQPSHVGHHGEREDDHPVRIGAQASREIRRGAEPDDAGERLTATELDEPFRYPRVSSQTGCSIARRRHPAERRRGRSRSRRSAGARIRRESRRTAP